MYEHVNRPIGGLPSADDAEETMPVSRGAGVVGSTANDDPIAGETAHARIVPDATSPGASSPDAVIPDAVVASQVFEAALVEDDSASLDSTIDFVALGGGEAFDATPAPSAAANNGDEDYVLAEVVDEPVRSSSPGDPNPFQFKAAPAGTAYDRLRTAQPHRYSRRNRPTSFVIAAVCFGGVLMVFVISLVVSEIAALVREDRASQRDWIEVKPRPVEPWTEDVPTGPDWWDFQDEVRRREEEFERLNAQRRAVEDLDGLIESDPEWPYSALSGEALSSIDRPLERVGFNAKPRAIDRPLAVERMSGEGLAALRFAPSDGKLSSKIVGAAWSADGSALFVLDWEGGIDRIDTKSWRVTAWSAARGGEWIAACRAGVVVAGGDDWLIVFDPQSLAPRGQFVGVRAESLAAATGAARVVTAAGGALRLIDLERGLLTHVVDSDTARVFLSDPYRESRLLNALDAPSIWSDGKTLVCRSSRRCCVFAWGSEKLYLSTVGPRKGELQFAVAGGAEDGRGVAVLDHYLGNGMPAGEARWFTDGDPGELFDSVRFHNTLVAAVASHAQPHTTFFVFDNARCSAVVAEDGPFRRITLRASGKESPVEPRGMAIDPSKARAAVWDDTNVWIVELADTFAVIDID